jgi:hypothetical protein
MKLEHLRDVGNGEDLREGEERGMTRGVCDYRRQNTCVGRGSRLLRELIYKIRLPLLHLHGCSFLPLSTEGGGFFRRERKRGFSL